ncbi:AAA family ATPase [Salinarimonas chemoclinalis]|uniref:AAA family ATPase n=1 Tax=Salinarimonas chemoclinalis TaxID=3241599 RepID=UPI003556BEDF
MTVPPRIEQLKIKNYRALKDVTLDKLTPLSALVGPNGSGKSTVFDVLAFLSECFSDGIRKAWDRRGKFRELRTRGSEGSIEIEIKYREVPQGPGRTPLITYHLQIDEDGARPVVAREFLRWTRGAGGKPYNILEYGRGEGSVITGEVPEREDRRQERKLSGPDVLAVSTLGTLAENPRVIALKNFITGWHMSYLSADDTRGSPESGPAERLSQSGDNLANVIQYLREQHPDRLEQIFATLQRRIPRIERVEAKPLDDGRLLLRIKDGPFADPILARYASDGTLKLLAYLTVLYDPAPPRLIGIEEPENFLHPLLLPELAEECQQASANAQLIVTTHSPFFIKRLDPAEVRVLYRAEDGFTRSRRVADMPGVQNLLDEGADLGQLWIEGHFSVGHPFASAGAA